MKGKISHSYTELPLATQGKADKSLGGADKLSQSWYTSSRLVSKATRLKDHSIVIEINTTSAKINVLPVIGLLLVLSEHL